MTEQYQTRSASISGAGGTHDISAFPKTSIVGENRAVGSALRSASIGSAFFRGDVPTFYPKNDLSNTPSSSIDDENGLNRSLDQSLVGDLGIVDSLGSLNLDGSFQALNSDRKDIENGVPSLNKMASDTQCSTPFFQQHPFFGGAGNNIYPKGSYYTGSGSLTPNVGPTNLVSPLLGSSKTPHNTWNNPYITSSAPAGTSQATPSNGKIPFDVKPFELPEETLKDNATGISDKNDFITNLNMDFASPKLDNFGGSLASQYPFNGSGIPFLPENYGDEYYRMKEGSSSESELENSLKSDSQNTIPGRVNYVTKGVGIENPILGEHLSFVPPDRPNSNEGNAYTNLKDVGLAFQNAPYLMPSQIPVAPGVWSKSQYGQNPLARSTSNLMGNRLPNLYSGRTSSIYSDRNNMGHAGENNTRNPHRRNHYNDGINVHRKAHASKRKADDASKYVNAKLEDFTGEIYSLCKDQHGCRFLQKQLDLGAELETDQRGKTTQFSARNQVAATMIFNEIYLKIVELMVDPFGNYLIQKLFENISADQRVILVKNSAPEFVKIALDPHGTRALQKLVECSSTQEESQCIISALSSHIVSLSRDLNGNHVVQKCLQILKPEDNQFIFDAASKHCYEIATHRHGCCVLQRCLDYGNESQRKQLSVKVAENAIALSLDPFGNYVVQYVLSRGDEASIEAILVQVRSNIMMLSLHKFGSNVIEKSLRTNKFSEFLVEELLKYTERFSQMLSDSFGNYVLQTSLDVAHGANLRKLCRALQPLLPSVKNTPHGRRITMKIQSITT